MARLWSSGFELGSATQGMEMFDVSGSPTVQSALARSGTYALQINNLVSGTTKHVNHQFLNTAGNGPYYARFYFRYATAPSGNNRIFALMGSGTNRITMQLTSTGTLRLLVGTSTLVGTSAALSSGTWYRVEVLANGTGGAGAGIVELKIDGSVSVTTSTASISGTMDTIRLGGNLDSAAQTQGDWYFDDCAVNDSTGAGQIDYPGSEKLVILRPNAAGDNAMGSRGGADSGSDFGQVNEVTPDDATSYYILEDNNDILDLNLDSTANAGIGASDTINVVHVGYRASGASASTYALAPRFKTQASGIVQTGTSISDTATTWFSTTRFSNTWQYKLTAVTDPQAGGSLTPALLDTSQIGIIATDALPDVYISTLWLLVGYTPAEAGTTTSTSISTSTSSTSLSTSTSSTSTSTTQSNTTTSTSLSTSTSSTSVSTSTSLSTSTSSTSSSTSISTSSTSTSRSTSTSSTSTSFSTSSTSSSTSQSTSTSSTSTSKSTSTSMSTSSTSSSTSTSFSTSTSTSTSSTSSSTSTSSTSTSTTTALYTIEVPRVMIKPHVQLSNPNYSLPTATMDDAAMTMDGNAGMGGQIVIMPNMPRAVIVTKPKIR